MKKLIFYLMLIYLFSCVGSSDDDAITDDDSSIDTSDGTGINISEVVQEFYKTENGVSVTIDEDAETITIVGTGLPDHKTPYYDVYDMEDEMYVDFPTYIMSDETYEIFTEDETFEDIIINFISYDDDGTPYITFQTNENDTIRELEFVMEIPMYPEEAEEKEETDLDEIGMALNGVAIFNNQAGEEIDIFPGALTTHDEAGGHPAFYYHYHLAGNLGIYTEDEDCSTYPTCDDGNLVGFLRDGFPLYGRQEPDGTYPDDLDEYGGHVGDTDEFDEDIYHYHTSNENIFGMDWHMFKSGAYFGTPGDYSVEVFQ